MGIAAVEKATNGDGLLFFEKCRVKYWNKKQLLFRTIETCFVNAQLCFAKQCDAKNKRKHGVYYKSVRCNCLQP